MRKGRLIVFFAVFLIFASLLRAVDITGCTDDLQGNTEYRLTADIINSTSWDCFTIYNYADRSNITLDCQNHIVDSDGRSSEYGYGANGLLVLGAAIHDNLTIKNCIFSDWQTNAYVTSFNNSDFENLTSISEQWQALKFDGDYSTFNEITIMNDSGDGAGFSGNYNTITNIYSGYGASGVGGTHNHLSHFYSDGAGWVALGAGGNYNTFDNLTIINAANAIDLGASSNNTFTDILILNSSGGIQTFGDSASYINFSNIIMDNVSSAMAANWGASLTYFNINNAYIANGVSGLSCSFCNFTNVIVENMTGAGIIAGGDYWVSPTGFLINISVNNSLIGIEISGNVPAYLNNVYSYNNHYATYFAGMYYADLTPTIENISITQNDFDVVLDAGCGGNVIAGIILNGGIYSEGSGNLYANMTLMNGVYGFYLNRTTSETLVNDTIYNNTYGVFISGVGDSAPPSQGNIFANNTIFNNAVGFYLQDAGGNLFYNNLLLNTLNVQFNSVNYCTGFWDEGSNCFTSFDNQIDCEAVGGCTWVVPIVWYNDWNTTNQTGPNIVSGPNLGGNYWANAGGTGYSQTCPSNSDRFCTLQYNLTSPQQACEGTAMACGDIMNETACNNQYDCYWDSGTCYDGMGAQPCNTLLNISSCNNQLGCTWDVFSMLNADYLPLTDPCGSSSLNITTWDEITNQQIYFNAYITNGTSSMSVSNVWSFSESDCNTSLPTGNVTVAISNSSYYSPRYYVGYIGNAILKAYLLPLNDSHAVLGTFFVQDAGTSPAAGIPNAEVDIYKDFGGILVLISQRLTDSIGSTTLYVDSQTQYVANASAVGYIPKTVAASFYNSTTIYIPLNRIPYSLGFGAMFEDINYTLLPEEHYIYNYSSVNASFLFSVTSKNGTLVNYGMNITNASGVLIFTGSGSAPYGGSIPASINASLHSDYLNVTFWIYSPTFTNVPYVQTVKYSIYGTSNETNLGGLLGAGGLLATSGLTQFAIGILAIIISLVVSGAFATFGFSVGQSGVLFTIVLTLFAAVGVLSLGLWIGLIMMTVAFVILRWL